MPSLSALREFKDSFDNIGGQKADFNSGKIPDDMEFPDSEPEALAREDLPAETGGTGPASAPNDSGNADSATPVDVIDFSAFTEARPDNLPNVPAADLRFPDDNREAAPGGDNFNPPEELLSNLSEELESLPPEELPPADTETGTDADNADDFNFPEELLTANSGVDMDLDSLDNFDFPEEPIPAKRDNSLDVDGLDDFSLLEGALAANGSDNFDPAGPDNFDIPEELAAANNGKEPADVPPPVQQAEGVGTDNPADPALPDEAAATDLGDSFDAASLDDFAFPDEPVLAGDNTDIDFDNLDNLNIPEAPLATGNDGDFDPNSLDNFELPDELLTANNGSDPDNTPPSPQQAEDVDADNLADLELPDEAAFPDGGDSFDAASLDDFAFPDEPVPADDNTDIDPGGLDDFDFPAEMAAGGDDGFDLDSSGGPDLPGAQDLDVDNPGGLDLPDEAAFPDESGSFDPGSLDDFAFPAEPVPADDNTDIDPGSLDDFDFPAEMAAGGDDGFDLDSLGDMALPDDPMAAGGDDGFDLDSLGGLDLPDTQDLDIDSLGDLDLPDEAAFPDESGSFDPGSIDEDTDIDLDSLGDMALPDDPMAAGNDDGFDLGSLGGLDLPDTQDLDIDSLGDLDLPDEAAFPDESGSFDPGSIDEDTDIDLDSLGGLDLPDAQDLDIDSLGDLELPDEAASTDRGDTFEPGDFDDFAFPADPVPADKNTGIDLDNLDSLEPSPADEAEDGDTDSQGFLTEDNGGSLDLDSLIGGFDLPNAALPTNEAGDFDIDDFSFPDLDHVLKDTRPDTGVKAEGKGKGKGKRWGQGKAKSGRPAGAEAIPEDVEELQLTEDELEDIKETLSRYPINLRIACEEIIAEQVIDPKLMSELIEHLVWGASAKETAPLAGRILGKTIIVPKAFEKSTGAALEAEQASFGYRFVHNFLPALRVFMFIALVAASCFYLVYNFVYTPLKAESIYKIGHERIFAGEYQRANERFSEAFEIHRKKDWFFKYAEAFRDERQYIYAEQKYDELLRYYPRDKQGVLDYAGLETHYLRNYEKADGLLRRQLLDYSPNDPEGLLAAGDNCLTWGEIDPSKYEDARYFYARMLDQYGWQAPVVERMMRYFIRTDNLKEVLPLKQWFDNNPKWSMSAVSLGELGGFLLDKKLEEVQGVPDEYVEHIDGIYDILLKAVQADSFLPEPHYHLARYFQNLGSAHEERESLRQAVRAFELAPEESVRRLNYRIDAHRRYADVLIDTQEFIPAEEQFIKGVNLYEDAVSRRLISRSPQHGRLYAGLGDLEYFTKTGDMEAALRHYRRSENDGWAPPEMQYRMGSAYYQLEDWRNALEHLFDASSNLPQNRRILFAMGNTALKRGDYFAANSYYSRLLDILEAQRARLPVLLPNDGPEYLELAERLMMARNNAGAANEMLSAQTGDHNYHTSAMALYAEAQRAWDARTRDPQTMIRSGSTPLPYLNMRNALYPQANYEPQIFIRIDQEAMENSPWEERAPLANGLGSR